jgi:hypothetical protein
MKNDLHLISMRVSPQEYAAIAEQAQQEERPLAVWCKRAIAQHLAQKRSSQKFALDTGEQRGDVAGS